MGDEDGALAVWGRLLCSRLFCWIFTGDPDGGDMNFEGVGDSTTSSLAFALGKKSGRFRIIPLSILNRGDCRATGAVVGRCGEGCMERTWRSCN